MKKNICANKKIIIFDFDGVIADSFEAVMIANRMINPEITDDYHRDLFNNNINDRKISLSEDEARISDQLFFDAYIPLLMESVNVFPGIPAIIKELSKNYHLLIISSTLTCPIQKFMGKNGLISYFDEVMGNDIHNSKIVKIKMVFSKHNARPNDCVFITDTLGDMREAASCDVSSIGVTWGYHKKENLLKGNPYQIAENPENLHEIITNYFK